MTNRIETHPLAPFIPANGKILMLGSFPPPRARWKMDFYYPNFQNDMWRVMGLVFFADKDYFVEAGGKQFKEVQIRAFLQEKGIAISDAAYQVKRLQGNASDKFLEVVQAVDLAKLLAKMPACNTILTTGDKATDTLLSLFPADTAKPVIGQSVETEFNGRMLRLYRLPSTSRAYPLLLEKKAAAYRAFFQEIGVEGA